MEVDHTHSCDPRDEVDTASSSTGRIVAGEVPGKRDQSCQRTSSGQANKFQSLKRKLFPNRLRATLPAHIPPLVTSPTSVHNAPLLEQQDNEQPNSNSTLRQSGTQWDCDKPELCSGSAQEPDERCGDASSSRSHMAAKLRSQVCAHNADVRNEDDDDDLELEIAIEVRDICTEQDALDEVSDLSPSPSAVVPNIACSV